MDILYVCYANLCRSPMAERLTRHAIAITPDLRELRLVVSSAGTHAEPGTAMHPLARAVLMEAGVDASGFATQALSVGLLERAGLVLTATRQQRADCVRLAPAALRRTFTLRDFGRRAFYLSPDLVHSVAPRHRLAALVDEVLRTRSDVPPPPGDTDDLADPVTGTPAEMRACAAQVRASLAPVLALLGSTASCHGRGSASIDCDLPTPPEAGVR